MSSQVLAADLPELKSAAEPPCSISGIVFGGGQLSNQSLDFQAEGLPARKSNDRINGGFGELAADLVCGAWTFQADAAAYGFWSGSEMLGQHYDLTQWQGHIGGAAFWRDEDKGSLGLSASYILQQDTLDFAPLATPAGLIEESTAGLWRAGGFGELYLSDHFTLGAGAYMFTGDRIDYFAVNLPRYDKGIEAFAKVSFYPDEAMGLSLRADVISSKSESLVPVKIAGFALTGEAEYRVEDTNLSLFAGGRYALRDIGGSFYDFKEDTLQAYVGLKYTFGNSEADTLAQRDRRSAYDNTSVFHEKLPRGNYSVTGFN